MWRPGTCCAPCLKLRKNAGTDFCMTPRPQSSSKVETWMRGRLVTIYLHGSVQSGGLLCWSVTSPHLSDWSFNKWWILPSPVPWNTLRGGWSQRRWPSARRSWNISCGRLRIKTRLNQTKHRMMRTRRARHTARRRMILPAQRNELI